MLFWRSADEEEINPLFISVLGGGGAEREYERFLNAVSAKGKNDAPDK